MRSVIVARAVEAFGFEGIKKTLSFVSCDLVVTVWRWSVPCERHVVARAGKDSYMPVRLGSGFLNKQDLAITGALLNV